MLKRLAKELLYLAFTLAGVGLVLITLTDQVLRWAIYISVISLVMHLAGVAIDYREDNISSDISPATAALLAGISAVAQVLQKLAAAFMDDGKLDMDEINAAFAGTTKTEN